MERREHPRAPLAVPIRMIVGDTHRFALQHSRDLSTGGIFVQTRRRYEEGAEVEMEFYFRRQRRTIPVKGVVVRSMPEEEVGVADAGVAIRFVRLDAVARRFIELTIDRWNLHNPSQILNLPENFFEEADQVLGRRH